MVKMREVIEKEVLRGKRKECDGERNISGKKGQK